MCGRYIFYDEENKRLQALIEKAKDRLPYDRFSTVSLYEVYPSQNAFGAVYIPQKKEVESIVMKWGYPGYHGNIVINARSETAFTSSFFRDSRPCVLPATGYYEWSKDKDRYCFFIEEKPFYLGGICRRIGREICFVILTEPAAAHQLGIHDRQPVLFGYEDAKKWCASLHPTSLLENSIQYRSFVKA